MTEAEARDFEREPYAADAIAVRRWDDLAKDPAADVPGFDTTARCSPHCCEPRDRRTDGPQLPGPVVDVTEDPAADRAGLPSWSGRYVSSAGSPRNSVTSSRGSPCVSRRNS